MFRKKKSKSSQLSSNAKEPSNTIKSTIHTCNIFDIKSFEKQQKISQVSMSEYYEISDEKTNDKYTASILLERINELSKQKLIEITTNLNMIMKLNHPTILKYIGFSL